MSKETTETPDPRKESLRDKLATIIQEGTTARKTSYEIAGEVHVYIAMCLAADILP